MLQPLGDIRQLEIRTRHLVVQVQQQFGNAAHADAADADEVNVVFFRYMILIPLIRGRFFHEFANILHNRQGRFRPPSVNARAAIAPNRAAVMHEGFDCVDQHVGTQFGLPDHPCSPGVDQGLRVARLVVVGCERKGYKNRRPADDGDFGDGCCPGPATIRSACR
jgi:hypothetical protein